MKRSIYLFLALLGAYNLSAQCPGPIEGEPKSSYVTTAYSKCNMSSQDNDPVAAAPYIESAILHEKTKVKAKTWTYRGDIYVLMSELENNPCPQALEIAKESYVKAKELDSKGLKTEAIEYGLLRISSISYNKGLEGYNSKEYAMGAQNFLTSADSREALNITDSIYMQSYYNAALCYENAGETDKAVSTYEKCAATGYESKQCYFRIIATLQTAERLDESLEFVQKGKEMFPEEPEFLIQETNFYLKSKEFEKAEGNLKKAIENDPENAMLNFVLGTAMDALNKSEGAVDAYKRAIEIDPDYLDAYHNLGASYVNSSVSLKEEINSLDFRKDGAKIDKLEKESDKALENALPYLEKALELEPGNVQVMNSLKSIYFAFEKMDKYNEMKEKIDSMK